MLLLDEKGSQKYPGGGEQLWCFHSKRERTVSQKCQVEGECCHQHDTLLSCAKRLCIKHTTSLSGDFECNVPCGTLLIIHEFALYHIIILSFILH